MDSPWTIVYYQTGRDKVSPVYVFIESLELKAQAKVSNTLDLLEKYGVRLGSPHAKKIVGAELWELRIVGGDSIRILYVAVTGRALLLLHGFVKKKQKTDTKELKTAVMRLGAYRIANIT